MNPGPSDVSSKFKAAPGQVLQSTFITRQGTTETSPGKTISSFQRPSTSKAIAIPVQDASAATSEVPTSIARVIDEPHQDEEMKHSKKTISAWIEYGKGLRAADFRPHEYTTQPTNDEGQKIESVHHISSSSALHDEISVQNRESRDDLSEDADVIRLEKHGIEVRIPPHEAYSAKDVTVELIHDIPPELVLNETEVIIAAGLRMSPSDATFNIPVTVTMPHCGIFKKPEAAKVVTYYRKSGKFLSFSVPFTLSFII
eukprot:XP_011679274.1 PREDICTED: uncharacterized protein LOC105445433 [Strongylocentrotus purpuratus]